MTSEEAKNLLYCFKMYAPNLIPTLIKSITKEFINRDNFTIFQDFSDIYEKVIKDPVLFLADCVFEVEEKKIYAHKVIMCTRSEYFR